MHAEIHPAPPPFVVDEIIIFSITNEPILKDTSFHKECNVTNEFQALRARAMQARINRKPLPSEIKPGSVIENVANTRRLAETTLGPSTIEEQATNTGSGSGDEDEDGAEADCHVISNDKSTEFILATVVEEAA